MRNRHQIVRFRYEIVMKSYDFDTKSSPNRTKSIRNRHEIVRFRLKSSTILGCPQNRVRNRTICMSIVHDSPLLLVAWLLPLLLALWSVVACCCCLPRREDDVCRVSPPPVVWPRGRGKVVIGTIRNHHEIVRFRGG